MNVLAAILTAALPHAQALMKFIDLAIRHKEGAVSEKDAIEEIERIRGWAESAEESDRRLFEEAKLLAGRKG